MQTSFLAHRSGGIFGPSTLEDNWYEDREQDVAGEVGGKMIGRNAKRGFARRSFENHFNTAPRQNRRMDLLCMRRCLAEDPEAYHDTTSRSDFSSPVKGEVRATNALVRIDTFKHTKNPRPTEKPQTEVSMWSTHPRHPAAFGRREFATTTQSEYDNGLAPKEDPMLPDPDQPQECRGGHEKASSNFKVFPFGHAKNNFEVTPGARTTFWKSASITGPGISTRSPNQEDKRFGRRYAFTGMARRAGARVFYDEPPPLAQ